MSARNPTSAIVPEQHRGGTNLSLRDFIIGFSDGLTVPFALAAGLAGVLTANTYIIIAGLAEIVAGAISMGVGGYLATRNDLDHYAAERQREIRETHEVPETEIGEVQGILENYGLSPEEATGAAHAIARKRETWVDFMMLFELGLSPPTRGRLWKSPVTIGGAYAIGGFVPLTAYFFVSPPHIALLWSAGVTLVALAVFGFTKGRMTGVNPWRSAAETVLIGGIAALAAYVIALRIRG